MTCLLLSAILTLIFWPFKK
ncbi:MAG: hypothetical protein ACLQAH_11345 [Limisphaerales bacterium]